MTVDAGSRPAAAVQLIRLQRAHLPMLAQWLADERVRRWWAHETTPAAVERDFGPAIDGADATVMCIATLGGRPFGFVQHYRLADSPDSAAQLARSVPVRPGALSLDYLIGDPRYRGKGLAPLMISACLDDAWRRNPRSDQVIVPVHADNGASRRTLERAGFAWAADGLLPPDNPADDERHAIYVLSRARSETPRRG